jgi:hypothetical protein
MQEKEQKAAENTFILLLTSGAHLFGRKIVFVAELFLSLTSDF